MIDRDAAPFGNLTDEEAALYWRLIRQFDRAAGGKDIQAVPKAIAAIMEKRRAARALPAAAPGGVGGEGERD